jgi:hypothetical protein
MLRVLGSAHRFCHGRSIAAANAGRSAVPPGGDPSASEYDNDITAVRQLCRGEGIMSFRRSRGYRAILLVLCLAVLGGVGYFAYTRFRAPKGDARALVEQASAAYERGRTALDASQFAQAAEDLDRAVGLTSAGLSEAEKQAQATADPKAKEAVNHLAGELLWVRARAVRDRAFARAAAAGKPIPTTPDSTYRSQFRSFFAIPDEAERKEALNALLAAPRWAAPNPELLKEALRAVAMVRPLPWPEVERLAKPLLELQPDEPRARWLLADYEFEQPSGTPPAPTPDDRKSRARVAAAWEHLTRAKASGSSPYWRTAALEARILKWWAAHGAGTAGGPGGPGEPAKAADALRELLFNPTTGSVARAASGEQFSTLGTQDVEGLIELLGLAGDAAAAEAKPEAAGGRALAVARAAGAARDRAASTPEAKTALGPVTQAVLRLAVLFAPLAGPDPSPEWQSFFDKARGAAAESAAHAPAAAVLLARLVARQWYMAVAAGQPVPGKDRLTQAVAALESSLRAPGEPPAADREAALGELMLLRGDPAATIEPHLTAARGDEKSRAAALARLYGGALAARDGRLSAARQLVEPLVGSDQPDVGLRAGAVLAHAALASGQPAPAVTALRQLAEADKRTPPSPEERGWVALYFPGPREVEAQVAVAHLGVARQRYERAKRETPGAPPPADLLAPHERAVTAALKSLPASGPANRAVRIARAEFLLAVDRTAEADKELAALAADYPDSAAVARVAAERLVHPAGPAGATADQLRAADEKVRGFAEAHPRSAAAQLLWAEWLARSGRGQKAVAAARAAGSLLGGRQEPLDRALAALAPPGEQTAFAQAVAGVYPRAELRAAVLRSAVERAGGGRSPTSLAFAPDGYTAVATAAELLAGSRAADAAAAFASSVEYAAVTPAARAGVVLAIEKLAGGDAPAARAAAARLATGPTQEPAACLGAAVAAVAAGDLGTLQDAWSPAPTAGAALAKWEAAARAAGQGKEQAAKTRAALWAAATGK